MQMYRAAAFLAYGSAHFTRSAYLQAAKSYSPDDPTHSLKGKHVVITGANAGLGLSTAQALAAKGATVHALCRSQERGEAAVKDIKEASGNQNVFLEVVDMASLSDIRSFAARYKQAGHACDLLINNAGCMQQTRQLSPDGLEMNFAVNVGGVVALTELLLPSLTKAAPQAKVISVATGGVLTETLHKDLQLEDAQSFDGTTAYARNKRVQLAVTEKWGEMYGSRGIGFYCTHPGWVDTVTLQKAMPGFYSTFKARLRTPEEGADTTVWLALQPNERLEQGGFYFDRQVAEKHLPLAGTRYRKEEVDPIYVRIRHLCGLPPLKDASVG